MARDIDETARAAGKARGAIRGLRGYAGIFRTLAEEHGAAALLMRKVSGSNDPDVKRSVFDSLCTELVAHGRAEDQELYPVLRDHAAARALAEQAGLEHLALERRIAELRALDPATPEWGARFEELARAVREHVEQEEHDLFPLAKEALTSEQIHALDARYRAAREAQVAAVDHPADGGNGRAGGLTPRA